MKKRDYSHQIPLCSPGCNCLFCDFDPEWEAILAIAKEKDDFYAQLGWDAETQAKFFFDTVCVEMLSKDELLILLDMEISAFIDKCHPLLLSLLNSLRDGGADV